MMGPGHLFEIEVIKVGEEESRAFPTISSAPIERTFPCGRKECALLFL